MGVYSTHLLLKRGLKLDIGVVIEIRRAKSDRNSNIMQLNFMAIPTLFTLR